MDGPIAPNFRDGALVDPTLIQYVNGSDNFDDFEEATFPFLAVFGAIKEDLGFGACLSSMDADFGYFLWSALFSEKLNPAACFFQGLLVPGQALEDLWGSVSNRVRMRGRYELPGGLQLVRA